jgi:hypothetical protein
MDNQQAIWTLSSVANDIHTAHKWFSEQAVRQVNTALTLRNWVIGLYIREYEQHGADRAQYGEKVLLNLSKRLHQKGLKSMGERRLREYRLFYQMYPQIWRTASAKFQSIDNQNVASLFLPQEIMKNVEKINIAPSSDIPQTDPDILVNHLTFSRGAETDCS